MISHLLLAMGPKSQYLLRFIHKISWNHKCTKTRLLLQQEFHPILHLLLAVQDTMWQKCIWDIKQWGFFSQTLIRNFYICLSFWQNWQNKLFFKWLAPLTAEAIRFKRSIPKSNFESSYSSWKMLWFDVILKKNVVALFEIIQFIQSDIHMDRT